MKIYLILLSALIVAIPAKAQDLGSLKQCPPIKDSMKRLKCFDLAARNLAEWERQRDIDALATIKATELDAAARAKLAEGAAAAKAEAAVKAKQEQFISESNNALRAVRKLVTRVQTGISYRDYPAALSDAKLEVNSFSDGAFSGMNKEFSGHLLASIVHFEKALTVWRKRFSGGGILWDVLWDKDPLTQNLVNEYAGMDRARDKWGKIPIQAAVSVIWSEAADRAESAAAVLRK